MLSQKMTVSLMSLVIFIAIALLALPASALFSVKVDTSGDVSHADNFQLGVLTHATNDTALVLEVTIDLGKAAPLVAGDMKISGYSVNETSGAEEYDPRVVLAATNPIDPTTASDSFTVDIVVGHHHTTPAMAWHASRVRIVIDEKKLTAHDPFDSEQSAKLDQNIHFLAANPPLDPLVYRIELANEFPVTTITTETFEVRILLGEEPRGGFKTDHLDVAEATISKLVKLVVPTAPGTIVARNLNPGTDTDTTDPGESSADPTWRDGELQEYLVTLTTKEGEKTVTVKVKSFESQERPAAGSPQDVYTPHAEPLEGRDLLTVKTKRDTTTTAKLSGLEVNIPKEKRIPKDGYLVVARNRDASEVDQPDGTESKDEPKVDKRTPAQLLYNVIEVADLPNLETFLLNGGTIDLIGPENIVISEIMWGSDLSLSPNNNSQWIEIRNLSGKSLQTGDKNYKLVFYGINETLRSGEKDRVGTVPASGHWSIAGKGQSGRSGTGEDAVNLQQVAPLVPLISMQRVFTGNTADDGTAQTSWVASTVPALNFDPEAQGQRIGTPGAAPVTYPEPPPPAPEPVPEPVIPVATAGQIAISEIMVDTADGRLPQWIELTNTSAGPVQLTNWSLDIENDATDAEAVSSSVRINLSDASIGASAKGKGQSLLLVAWAQSARRSGNLQDAGVAARVIDVATQLEQRTRYTLLSESAFKITLVPPQSSGITLYGDSAGNLGAATAWELPMAEGGQRSSLIRVTPNTARQDGTQADSWVLAEQTALTKGPLTWFGSDEDAGTPGYVGGGPLPVQLSRFTPARDRITGAVVISWETQSELNNAGFYIKRSQQRDGQFTVINAAMVPGAGTTSEKQSYTYTDTTAAPNIVYYYQIEEVSLDGQRLTLTPGTRLKGHISAAGKATLTWGALKAAHESQ